MKRPLDDQRCQVCNACQLASRHGKGRHKAAEAAYGWRHDQTYKASAAAELKRSEGSKDDKEISSGNVLTSVEEVADAERVADAEMDGRSTSSVPVVHDSGASQRDVDDVAATHLDRSAVSTLSSSSLSSLEPSSPDQSAFLEIVGREGVAITTNTQVTSP